jgi:hypothetical protein
MELLPEILFSTIFVLIGSLVFHLSSLISGFSLFRESPPQLALLGAMIAGLIVFIGSPIGFISFFPENFVRIDSISITDIKIPPQKKSVIESEELRRACYPIAFQKMLSANFALPFLASAIGLGIVFGSLTRLSFREAFFIWFRRKYHLQYKIYTYKETWDGFLTSLKESALVSVTTNQKKKFTGKLINMSVRDEKRAIGLRDYTVQDAGKQPEKAKFDAIIISNPNILNIEAKANAFNRHSELMPHESQAFYGILAAFGLGLLSTAMFRTGIVVYQNGFEEVFSSYCTLAVLFFLAHCCVTLISIKTCRLDYSSYKASMAISPIVYKIAIFSFSFSLISVIWSLSCNEIILGSTISILLFAAILMYKLFALSRITNDFLTEFAKQCPKERLKSALDHIYDEIDLNNPKDKNLKKVTGRIVKNILYHRENHDNSCLYYMVLLNQITNNISNFIEKNPFLKEEDQVRILIKARAFLSYQIHHAKLKS